MRPNVRNTLNLIDKVLAVGDADARELWSILTALRGPDSKIHEFKVATTSVIRYTAFPLAAIDANERGGPLYASMTDDSETSLDIRLRMDRYSVDHFTLHTTDAFRALDLMWGEINASVKNTTSKGGRNA